MSYSTTFTLDYPLVIILGNTNYKSKPKLLVLFRQLYKVINELIYKLIIQDTNKQQVLYNITRQSMLRKTKGIA